jgi:hypothetical protein
MPEDRHQDLELLRACRRGDGDAFAVFFRRHRGQFTVTVP